MIYLQYDDEFDGMLVRVIWVGKHKYDESYNFFDTDDYLILAEFENDGIQPEFKDLIGKFIPRNNMFINDNMAYKIIYDKIFIDNNDWPHMELR